MSAYTSSTDVAISVSRGDFIQELTFPVVIGNVDRRAFDEICKEVFSVVADRFFELGYVCAIPKGAVSVEVAG